MNKIFAIIESGYIQDSQYNNCVGFFLIEDQAKLFSDEFQKEDDRCLVEARVIYNKTAQSDYKTYREFSESVAKKQREITNKYFSYDYSEISRYRRYYYEEIEKFNLDKEYAILKLQK